MAVFGGWGNVVFTVSQKEISTFDEMEWQSSVNYATHERHCKEPLLEYTGTEVETISFTMFFSAFLGINPIEEVSKLLRAMSRGEVHRLIIGPKGYGTNRWVIKSLDIGLQKFDNHGLVLASSVKITLNSYSGR